MEQIKLTKKSQERFNKCMELVNKQEMDLQLHLLNDHINYHERDKKNNNKYYTENDNNILIELYYSQLKKKARTEHYHN